MRKLFVCLFVGIMIAGLVAHYRGGVAAMSAEDLGERAAAQIIAQLERAGAEVPINEPALRVIQWILIPGAYTVSRIGIDPGAEAGLAVAALIGWWTWLTVVRLSTTIFMRHMGIGNVGWHHLWLWLTPPWRPVYRLILQVRRWHRQFLFGPAATAAWTGVFAAMTLIYRPHDSVFIGSLWIAGFGAYQALGIRGPRHVTVVAAAGAGKTRWLMAYLGMLHQKASAFVIDCDGQMVNSLGVPLQRKGHKIFNLNPYHLTKFPGASWNALEELTRAAKRHGRKAVVRFALTLAEALIQETNNHQPIFSQSARKFLHGLILFVWLFEPEERRNLCRVRELLARGFPERVLDPKQDPFDVLISVMEQCVRFDDGCDGLIVAVIARAAGLMRSGKGREGNPFRSTAISQTAWLDVPEIAAISQRSDFAGEDLKLKNHCVFICMPVVDIQTKCAGWVRALTMMTMYAFQNMPGKMKIPCSFCLDELPALGRLEIIETAAPVFRKYGVRIIAITQDLERLRHIYPNSWGGIIGNSQCAIWLSSDYQETLKYLSDVLGTTTYVEEIKSGWFSKVPPRMEKRERPLMTPDQLREFLDPGRGQFIVTRTGKSPLRVAYVGYDKALGVCDYERDTNFSEPLLRALTRAIIESLRSK